MNWLNIRITRGGFQKYIFLDFIPWESESVGLEYAWESEFFQNFLGTFDAEEFPYQTWKFILKLSEL